MTAVTDVFSENELNAAIHSGFIESFRHPQLPLTIYNYTEHTQYENAWNAATRACRGLIVNDDRQIIARPWAKFFEYKPVGGQHGPVDLDAAIEATDKLDGSLGILYPAGHQWAIATRGSFTGNQAAHATTLYQQRYADTWSPDPELTYLFEIVYPDNRVVLNYGDTDDLVLLGACRIADGASVTASSIGDWPGSRAETLPVTTFRDALAFPERTNAEGLVVTVLDSGLKLKLKQRDYVLRHRMVAGMSVLAVWEYLASGAGVSGLITDGHLPDELHDWARDVVAQLQGRHHALKHAAEQAHAEIIAHLEPGHTRKDYAAEAVKHADLKGFLFALADGRRDKFEAALWKSIRPDANELNPQGASR